MTANGATRIYAKKLAPNDNSKNQVYLGGSFGVLNIVPFGKIVADEGSGTGDRARYKAPLQFQWLSADGVMRPAPGAQLILYPAYPEVRMSGFLKRADSAPSEILASRAPGRTLFLGVRPDNTILGHASAEGSEISAELRALDLEEIGTLLVVPVTASPDGISNTSALLLRLREIAQLGWTDSKRLTRSGEFVPCRSQNCGGYTLEALLGISPNGISEPDFLGWEIKQHTVSRFSELAGAGVITLMTPEPTGGWYRDQGPEAFVRKYGYTDRLGRVDRINFGGIYRVGKTVTITKLTPQLKGYDKQKKVVTDFKGGFVFIDKNEEVAAMWDFPSLLGIWSRKHAKAAYIQSLKRTVPQQQYAFGHFVHLARGTSFELFLGALADGDIYLDPALKVEGASGPKPRLKRRNQFRIKANALRKLYDRFDLFDVRL